MTWFQAFILGLVEGITEYLPVSSTGHLLLVQRAFGIGSGEAADAYAICIQGGAIVAVLGLYFKRVLQMANGILGRDPVGLRLSMNLLAGFVPAAVIGLLFEDWIRENLFGGEKWGLWPTVTAWFVGGVAILATGWFRRNRQDRGRQGFEIEALTWQLALIIGFAQCIAMWPGTSRSLVTIVGGVLVGMRLAAAVEFSFLLGVLTLGAATAYDAMKSGAAMLEEFGWVSLIIGFVTAWISAVIAVKWMVSYLTKHGLGIFGYYRIALAVCVAVAIWLGFFDHSAPSPAPDSANVGGHTEASTLSGGAL